MESMNGDEGDTTIKTWESVEEVLTDVQREYAHLADRWEAIRRAADDERTRGLLKLRADGARESAAALRVHTEELSEPLRRTRIQFRPKRTLESLLAELDTENPTVESVTRAGLFVDGYFEELFESLQAMASANGAVEVQEMFAALRDRARESKQVHARQANSTRDV